MLYFDNYGQAENDTAIRRTKYDRLRKSYGTDRFIEKEVYLAYYNKLLTRVRSYAKRNFPREDNHEYLIDKLGII